MNSAEQQKLYIDVEEEITTVIDHLRYVQAQNVVLVVPQHALILQSVVNLKILTQEARKLRKNIVIMTNDTDGVAFAERAGIATQKYVSDEEQGTASPKVVQPVRSRPQTQNLPPSVPENPVVNTQKRIQENIGGNSFHTNAHRTNGAQNISGVRQGAGAPIAQQRPHITQQQPSSQRIIRQQKQGMTQQSHMSEVEAAYEDFSQFEQSLQKQNNVQVSGSVSQKQEPLVVRQNSEVMPKTKNKKTKLKKSFNKKSTSYGRSKKGYFLRGLTVFGGIIILVVLAFSFLPKTKMTITPKQVENVKDFQVELTSRSDQSAFDIDRKIIPARVIEREISFIKTFPATGSGDVDAQKAQGTVTIFNEFNDKPQPLVATTRFLSEDGTLFRLVKKTTVPGMKDGEPGKVEALVIADKAGESGNIGPTKFSVPGFDGTPKKGRFYAQSEKTMTGGGAGGTGVSLVTEGDISTAENNMNAEVVEFVQSQISSLLRPDSEVLIPEAVQSTVVRSEASMSPGTMGSDFMYEIVSQVKVIVFTQEDVRAVIQGDIDEDLDRYGIEEIATQLTYHDAATDYENETIKMKVKVDVAEVDAPVDVDMFVQDIKGVKHDDLLSVIETKYPDSIEKITIESVVPGFPGAVANRVSRFAFMTEVEVE